MDTTRYYAALLILSVTPPAFLYWFSIHPWIRLWRKLGRRLTLAIHFAAMPALSVLIFNYAKPLLSMEFGTQPLLIALAIPVFVASAVLRRRISRQLSLGTLVGMPELATDGSQTKLLTNGVYGRIRHPRYVQVLLVLIAYALFCNYLATYGLVVVMVFVVILLVRIEEHELRNRFGKEYDSYCARVPRFIPRTLLPDRGRTLE